MKVLGVEFKRFYSDPAVWGQEGVRDSTYVDDLLLKVDGHPFDGDVDAIDDQSTVEIESGYLVNAQQGCPEEFEEALRWWLRKQSRVSVLVEIDKTLLKDLDAWLTAAGGVRR